MVGGGAKTKIAGNSISHISTPAPAKAPSNPLDHSPATWPNSITLHKKHINNQIKSTKGYAGAVLNNMSTQGMEKKGHNYKCGTATDPLRSLSVHKPNFLNN